MTPLANHLWQSTLFAAFIALLALCLRKQQARVRHWLWMAASIKFLVPFSLLADIGGRLGTRLLPAAMAPQIAPKISVAIASMSGPFAAPPAATTVSANGASLLPVVLFGVWLCGCGALAFIWCMRWRRVRGAVRRALPLFEGREWNALRRMERAAGVRRPIPLKVSTASMEPGVFGVVRPVLILPEGIVSRLDDAQFEAILAHEFCHVQRRDNLTATIHMFVQAIFWFHPLLWWLGARLISERERACDEEVLRLGSHPEVYAAGILKTCQFCLESPLACVSGVTGSDLRKRIERIMTEGIAHPLDARRKLLLSAAACAALLAPVAIGLVTAPRGRAEPQDEAAGRPQFEVASVKATAPASRAFELRPTGNGVTGNNIPAKTYITWAYGIQGYQLSGGPDWLSSQTWDILAKAPPGSELGPRRAPKGGQTKVQLMMQSLLAERFKLAIHRETRELPVLALVVSKGGSKLKPAADPKEDDGTFTWGRGRIRGMAVTLAELAEMLSGDLKRTVLDRTGMAGRYDLTLEYTPEVVEPAVNPNEKTADPNGPSIFTALQEQLGLRLEATKGPVQILVIDHVEKPTEN